jgi:hypothetical protein
MLVEHAVVSYPANQNAFITETNNGVIPANAADFPARMESDATKLEKMAFATAMLASSLSNKQIMPEQRETLQKCLCALDSLLKAEPEQADLQDAVRELSNAVKARGALL